MVDGTIVVEENRSVIDKFRFWYKENVIDNGKSQEFEEKFDKGVEVAKNVVYVAGGVATVVLAICPVDGPVGEAIAVVATPLLAKVVEAGATLVKDVVLGTKRVVEEKVVHENGTSDKVAITENLDFNKVASEITEFKSGVEEVTQAFGGRSL